MKLIGQILHKYRTELGDDYHAYHHHALRVYSYALTLLLMRENKKLAIAAAFHDLDIWLGRSMDYLEGSEELARDYLAQGDFPYLPDEMAFFIKNHHKLTSIKGNIEAEAFRKADLIDLTGGRIRYHLPLSIITGTEQAYPRLGFTRLIMKKTFGHALKHPLRPLPMINW